MGNPIIEMMSNNRVGQMERMLSAVRSPQELLSATANDPRFSRFMEENKNKSVDQICRENGLDTDRVNSILRMAFGK